MIVTDDNLRRWKFVCENRENQAPSGQSGFSDDVVLSLIQRVEDQKDVVALRESEIAELRTSGSKQLTEVLVSLRDTLALFRESIEKKQ